MGTFKLAEKEPGDPVIDVIVRADHLNPKTFGKEVQKRSYELKDSGSAKIDVLREVKPLSDRATLFRVQRTDDAYVSELNFLIGSSMVTAELKSYRNQFLAAEETLAKFASSFKALDQLPPGRNGFCLGPVVLMGEFRLETADFAFRSANEKGSDFSVRVDTYGRDEVKPLLARVSGPDSLLSKFSLKHSVLRQRELNVAGMRAQEWLSAVDLGDRQPERSLKFVMETMRSAPNKTNPRIHLTFETGHPLDDGSLAPTTIPDDVAVERWDAVVASLRPRSEN
jgi:hypothetical protein